MASSRNSPGPHDRRDYFNRPKAKCTAKKRNGDQCSRYATSGRSGLCRFHLNQAKMMAGETLPGAPLDPQEAQTKGAVLAGVSTDLKKKFGQSYSEFSQNLAAKGVLDKLGLEPNANFDPKTALLATVESAWRQARVWEAMLSAIPEEDFDQLGVTPIPGVQSSSRGARIEIIQRNLTESTKAAARISKMALDAGIEERIVRIAEEQSALIADTVRAGIIAAIATMAQALRLSEADQARVLNAATQSAAKHLRELATGVLPDGTTIEGHAVEVPTE